MSQALRRPPARMVRRDPQQGPLVGRQTFGAVDQAKFYGRPEMGAQGGSPDLRLGAEEIAYHWQDFQQVNPAHEQPRLDFTSARQPFSRWGQLRRWSRTYMSASPRFQGRWFYVGQIQRAYAERARITGVTPNRGLSYVLPRFGQGPRTINLGP